MTPFEAKEKTKMVSIGLIQTTVSENIAANMKKTKKKSRSRGKRRSNCLPSRTV